MWMSTLWTGESQACTKGLVLAQQSIYKRTVEPVQAVQHVWKGLAGWLEPIGEHAAVNCTIG